MSYTKFLIYGLVEPSSDEVRYVGKSSHGLGRVDHHLVDISTEKTLCRQWVEWCFSQKLRPKVMVIEILGAGADINERMNERESYWIVEYRRRGNRLTNERGGGGGRPVDVREYIDRAKRVWGSEEYSCCEVFDIGSKSHIFVDEHNGVAWALCGTPNFSKGEGSCYDGPANYPKCELCQQYARELYESHQGCVHLDYFLELLPAAVSK